MFILTQDKMSIVNTANIRCICIDELPETVLVVATQDDAKITLGTYESVKKCKEIISDIFSNERFYLEDNAPGTGERIYFIPPKVYTMPVE